MARISKKRFNARLYIAGILITALVAVVVVAGVLLSSGLRYQTYPTSEHGDIKFLGEVRNGVPISGTVYYSDGTTAEVSNGKKADGAHEPETWQLTLTYSNGDVYEGECVYFLRHGQGKMTYAGGDVYEGEFIFDVMEGEGTYTYLSGDKYVGDFSDGKKNGKGIYTWAPLSDGTYDSYEGEYVDDMRDGEGTYIWADGSRYIGQYAADAKDGQGSMYFADGAYYQGAFVNDTRTGSGVYKWANGDVYEGEFYKNAITGMGTYTWSENEERKSYTGYFENGKIVIIDEGSNPEADAPIDDGRADPETEE
ncbi:MAG: hypothetical protein IJX76_05050 [Clostridia bacterium]|nr:hypothetical protein [Clostridia bacterium]